VGRKNGVGVIFREGDEVEGREIGMNLNVSYKTPMELLSQIQWTKQYKLDRW
jgi:hypothetical protein